MSIIATLLYLIFIGFIGVCHYEITKSKVNFHGGEFAKGLSLDSNKKLGISSTCVYITVMLILY